ncbi:MAG: FixH family protein [Rickettsiales bacterium]
MSDVAKRPSDKWIPWYFVAFFVVLAILDGIFVTIAFSTHRGVVTEHAYQKGLHYNQTIKAAEKQTTLGWESDIAYDAPRISIALKDAKGHPITNAETIAYFKRPNQSGDDFSVALKEQHKGMYGEDVSFPLKGQWDVRIVTTWKTQQYQKAKRIVVK